MANQSCLVIVKPDGLLKSLTGNVISTLSEAKLKILGAKIVSVTEELASQHYSELKENKPEIYQETLKYMMGKFHTNRVLALIYSGENAIEKIRDIVGHTNPEEALPISIRGKYGRINSKTGVFENCIHASDSEQSAEKEIKLWFKPHEIVEEIYLTKTIKKENEVKDWS